MEKRKEPGISSRLQFLYTDIGRGHPFYLDGIIDALTRQGQPSPRVSSIYDLSRGWSLRAWKTVRWMYLRGSSGGPIGAVYKRLRRNGDYTRRSAFARLLARDLRRECLNDDHPLVLAHPLLVGLLQGRARLIYQHGELIAPDEAIVPGADLVLVPTQEVAERFTDAGYDPDQVRVTGVCIEMDMVARAEAALEARKIRLKADGPMTGLLLSSGAEPVEHVRKLTGAASSLVAGGHRAVVLARQGGKLDNAIARTAARDNLPTTRIVAANDLVDSNAALRLLVYDNRDQENALTAIVFPEVDFLVSPPHERSNWAVGLGLPMFIVAPAIGPFAPLNRDLLVNSGVGRTMGDPDGLAEDVTRLRADGSLQSMAAAGWNGDDIHGFDDCARALIERYS